MRVFNGVYTIRNRHTGEHRTFKIRTQKHDAAFAAGKRIVSLLTGPDNGHSYKGFAFVNETGIFVWRRYQSGNSRRSAHQCYADMIWWMTAPGENWYKEKYELTLAKRCARCNRLLTHPESLLTGYGPECGQRGVNRRVVDAALTAPSPQPDPVDDDYDPEKEDPELMTDAQQPASYWTT